MAFPLIVLAQQVAPWIGLVVVSGAKEQVGNYLRDSIESWCRTAQFVEFATNKINAVLAAKGLALQFRDVGNGDAVQDDIDKFVAARINARMGTSFTSFKGLTREECLSQVGRVIAAQINEACGSNLSSIYPIAAFRSNLGTELLRQFGDDDLAGGALFDRDTVQRIKVELLKTLAGSKPRVEAADTVKAAQNRARQNEYRRNHKQVWVER